MAVLVYFCTWSLTGSALQGEKVTAKPMEVCIWYPFVFFFLRDAASRHFQAHKKVVYALHRPGIRLFRQAGLFGITLIFTISRSSRAGHVWDTGEIKWKKM